MVTPGLAAAIRSGAASGQSSAVATSEDGPNRTFMQLAVLRSTFTKADIGHIAEIAGERALQSADNTCKAFAIFFVI